MNNIELIVSQQEAGERLDAFLKNHLPDYSRAGLQRAIKSGLCERNIAICAEPATRLKAGDSVRLQWREPENKLEASDGGVEVLWEDGDLAVCAKPAGLTVHPCPSCNEETLVNRLIARFPQLKSQDGERPGIVHRLDKDTSGLILIALTERARLLMAEAFSRRQVTKEYLALVKGAPPEMGQCSEPIGRHGSIKTRMAIVPEKQGGRDAQTSWRKLWQEPLGRYAMLAIGIHSGRTHQIRVHMAHMGYPLLGDSVYAGKEIAALAPRQMLHAWKLQFRHPLTNQLLRFMLPPPDDFIQAALHNAHAMLPVIITGNQGCGKSAFCSFLHKLGLPTTSADQIVADLYSGKSAATEWISSHFGSSTLNKDFSVNKPALLSAMQSRPDLRTEFETAIHGLVLDRVENFWRLNAKSDVAVAEIPLFFESQYPQKLRKSYFVVGINCPKPVRWQRIASNRGWSDEKISTLESWQWTEERKMAACDLVIDNYGSADELQAKALELKSMLIEKVQNKNMKLENKLHSLCGVEASVSLG